VVVVQAHQILVVLVVLGARMVVEVVVEVRAVALEVRAQQVLLFLNGDANESTYLKH
jgi:hypothetical protein